MSSIQLSDHHKVYYTISDNSVVIVDKKPSEGIVKTLENFLHLAKKNFKSPIILADIQEKAELMVERYNASNTEKKRGFLSFFKNNESKKISEIYQNILNVVPNSIDRLTKEINQLKTNIKILEERLKENKEKINYYKSLIDKLFLENGDKELIGKYQTNIVNYKLDIIETEKKIKTLKQNKGQLESEKDLLLQDTKERLSKELQYQNTLHSLSVDSLSLLKGVDDDIGEMKDLNDDEKELLEYIQSQIISTEKTIEKTSQTIATIKNTLAKDS